MDARQSSARLRFDVRRLRAGIVVGSFCALMWAGLSEAAAAGPRIYREDFEGEQPSWTADYDQSRTRQTAHRRAALKAQPNERVEAMQFSTVADGQAVRLQHEIPVSRVHDELTAEVSVRSNSTGWTLWMEVVFPNEKDPRTGQPLRTWLKGAVYNEPNQWQELSCKTSDVRIRQQLQLLRKQLGTPLNNTQGSVVRSVALSCELGRGQSTVFIDNLSVGPLVAAQTPVVPVEHTAVSEQSQVKFELGRLSIEGRPFFLRALPYHNEPVDVMSGVGANTVWIPRQQDSQLLTELQQRGMWAIAIPPRARSSAGVDLASRDASLVPFGRDTSPILGWYLGTGISPDSVQEVISRSRQIRGADRVFRRPVIADVNGGERAFSRHVSMLSSSRPSMNSTFGLSQYRDWLAERRQMALPGTYTWTWIQTEPSSRTAEWRRRGGRRPIVIEPEQIRLQTYAALASGARGIGYWKTTPLDATDLGADERRLMISLLNLEMSLLEDWLGEGRLLSQVEFNVQESPVSRAAPKQFDYRRSNDELVAMARMKEQQQTRGANGVRRLEAAMIRCARGILLIPIYDDGNSQFVPGRMVARDVSIVVPGVPETASAYEITTTEVRSLSAKRGTGGMEIKLPLLDQTTMILLTTDRTIKGEMEGRVRQMADVSAKLTVELAAAKLSRVKGVVAELNTLSVSPHDSIRLTTQAEETLANAEQALERGAWTQAHRDARTTLQLARILQRAYWNDALLKFDSPVASCHTVCFQTLPDHWEMISALGSSDMSGTDSILRSGDFEDIDSMVVEGWRHAQRDIPDVQAGVELKGDSKQGQYCLRMFALPESPEAAKGIVHSAPVAVTSPSVTVHAGQILVISGWVRMVHPTAGSLDGFMIYDSIAGSPAAQRWNQKSGWQRFQMVREVTESGPFSISFVLSGLGEVELDDVTVVAHQPRETRTGGLVVPEQGGAESEGEGEGEGEGGIPFIRRIPGIGSAFGPDRNRN